VFVSNECLNRFSYKATIGFDTRKLRANRNSQAYESSLWRWLYGCEKCPQVGPACQKLLCWWDECLGWAQTRTTHFCDENQCRVDALIQENRRIKQRDNALKLGITQERMHHIIETLNYWKVCARCVPRQLIDSMKEQENCCSRTS